MWQRTRTSHRLRAVLIAILSMSVWARPNSGATKVDSTEQTAARDGQHDFDFEIGTWKTHVARLLHPLTGSSVWAQYAATTVVTKVWNGHSNLGELEVDGPQGHIELLWHFEQAFCADGGRTWEVNWIADDTRDAGPAR
jgi:hypothetical protein